MTIIYFHNSYYLSCDLYHVSFLILMLMLIRKYLETETVTYITFMVDVS